MRIFITGASGFIGRAVCAALAGHDCLALSRSPSTTPAPKIRRLIGDLFALDQWRAELEAFEPQACIHLAWSGLPDYSLPVSRKNFAAGLDLLDVLRRLGCRTVVSGTCWEYGAVSGSVSEDHAPGQQLPGPPGLFAAFKSAQRLVATSLYTDTGVPLLWARPFFVYGAGQRPASLLPSACKALAEGRTPDIRTPMTINDFIHVDDVAGGLAALAIGTGPPGIYNLGSGRPTRVRDAVNLLARAMGQADIYPPSAEAGVGFWAEQTRMTRDYQWTPRISLEEGIGRSVAQWQRA